MWSCLSLPSIASLVSSQRILKFSTANQRHNLVLAIYLANTDINENLYSLRILLNVNENKIDNILLKLYVKLVCDTNWIMPCLPSFTSACMGWSSLSRMRISVFEVVSIYPIDRHQNALPTAMQLHELNKVQLQEHFTLMNMILLVIWKRCPWVFYRWAVVFESKPSSYQAFFCNMVYQGGWPGGFTSPHDWLRTRVHKKRRKG